MDKLEVVEETELKEPLQPPLPPAPPDRCDYRGKCSWKDEPPAGNFTVYSFENLDGSREPEKAASLPSTTTKEPLYSTTEIVDMLQGLHSEIETLKDRIYCINNRRTSFVYENIEGKRRNSETRREHRDYLLQSAQDAGFHRLQFVLDPKVGCFRKFLWFLIVMCALGLLIFQLLDRVVLFISFPTEVNIQTQYVRNLNFPAVTICNRNMFRLTGLADIGRLEEVLAIYHSQNFSGSWQEPVSPRGSYLEDLRNVSHLKKDFIRGCVWQNEPCDLEDFWETPTDFGLCYTFLPRARKRNVYGTGPANGLSLLLNVEQYEYVLGTKSAVGARITVQEPGQEAWVAEKGVDLAVGMYTAVELEPITRRNAPPPHTACKRPSDNYTRDQCLRTCQRQFQDTHCRCSLDTGVTSTQGSRRHPRENGQKPSCDIVGYIKCQMNITDRWAAQGCFCQPECRVVEYRTFLSYAKLSAYAAESIVRTLEDRNVLEQKLQKARDKYHRIDKTICAYDVDKLQSTFKALDNVYNGIDEYVNFQHTDYKNTLEELQEGLEDLNKDVIESYSDIDEMTHVAFLSLDGRIRILLDEIDFEKTGMPDISLRGLLEKLSQILALPDSSVADSSPILEFRKGIIRFQQTIVNGYGQRYREFREHRKQYNITTDSMLATINDLSRLLTEKYSIAKNASGDRKLGQILELIFEDISQQKKEFVNRLHADHNQLLDTYLKDREKVVEFRKTLYNTSKTFAVTVKRLKGAIAELKPAFKRLHTQVQLVAMNFSNLRLSYDKKFLRKTEMATKVNGEDMKEALRSLRTYLNETRYLKREVTQASQIMTQSIKPIADRIADFKIMSRGEVQGLLDKLMFNETKTQVTKLTEKVEKTLSDISAYQSELREYLTGSKINGNFYLQNFMQVDVYFKELRETRITQLESYGLFDFGCDIGGTLALYIGISAFTLFEIIDFLCGTMLCKGNQKRMDVNL